jgi:hypothetical protein
MSLKSLALLVPVLGASAVVGPHREKIFTDGRPKVIRLLKIAECDVVLQKWSFLGCPELLFSQPWSKDTTIKHFYGVILISMEGVNIHLQSIRIQKITLKIQLQT